MITNNLTWKIGGEAGFGIMSSGMIFGKSLMRHGLSICDYVEYPSLIRGGHNLYIVRASAEEIFSPVTELNLLVALNIETITLHEHELSPGGGVIYDNETVKEPGFTRSDIAIFGVPLMRLARENNGEPVMMNGIAVGASLALLQADFAVLTDIFTEMFGRKGQEVVDLNVKIAKAGYDYITEHYRQEFGWQVTKIESAPKRMLISGSEAVGMGALKSGLKFFTAYPMTPINSLLAYLAGLAEKYSIIYKQPEDEISGVNMAMGASFAGVRSMTATSGGGFALMVETIGAAAMTETPLVVINGMRPGPATGLPTWTGQADIRFVLHAAQDEFPRVILAPGDPQEAFYLTHEAFNLAERYQIPVIIQVDKNLMESHWSQLPYDTAGLKIDRGKLLSDEAAAEIGDDYKRYRLTVDGVSPRKIPGQPGKPFLAGTDEHSEDSLFNEEAEMRVKMMNKRMKKLQHILTETKEPHMYGPPDAGLTIVGFGTTKLAVLEALKTLNSKGAVTNYLHYTTLWPLHVTKLQELAQKGQKLLAFEGNYSGQFSGLLFEHSGVSIPRIMVKYDGRQFFPEEVIEHTQKFLQATIDSQSVELIAIGGESHNKGINIAHAGSDPRAEAATQG